MERGAGKGGRIWAGAVYLVPENFVPKEQI
jgi:hypothetical protein